MPTTTLTTEEQIAYYKRVIKAYEKRYHPSIADVMLFEKFGDDPLFCEVFRTYCP